MYKVKNDRYRKNRGGTSRVLDITCSKCNTHICYYQKDGSGNLRRMYIDRMIDISPLNKLLKCSTCDRTLAIKIVYEKENRLAYRLFVDAIKKKVVSKFDIQ